MMTETPKVVRTRNNYINLHILKIIFGGRNLGSREPHEKAQRPEDFRPWYKRTPNDIFQETAVRIRILTAQ